MGMCESGGSSLSGSIVSCAFVCSGEAGKDCGIGTCIVRPCRKVAPSRPLSGCCVIVERRMDVGHRNENASVWSQNEVCALRLLTSGSLDFLSSPEFYKTARLVPKLRGSQVS